jgi:hypothetical protein
MYANIPAWELVHASSYWRDRYREYGAAMKQLSDLQTQRARSGHSN